MGVDFHGYSNVRTEPLPDRFRRVRKAPASEAAVKDRYKGLDPGMAVLARAIFGDPEDDKYECNKKAEEEFYKTIGTKKDFLAVCWHTNTIWLSTKETKHEHASASYGTYADFHRLVLSFYKSHDIMRPYMPPDTDLTNEHGIVSATNCRTCIKTLDWVRGHFVPSKWSAFGPYDESELEKNEWGSFFAQFYKTVARGAESGVLLVR